jgi:hypothetical protein
VQLKRPLQRRSDPSSLTWATSKTIFEISRLLKTTARFEQHVGRMLRFTVWSPQFTATVRDGQYPR